MNPIQRFIEYAAAFEQSFADDDWSRLTEFFSDDAVYRVTGGPPLGGVWKGRQAVLDRLKESVDELDRKFETRGTELLGAPRVIDPESGEEPHDGHVRVIFGWRGTYSTAGMPDLVFSGDEVVAFSGNEIRMFEDRMHEGCDAAIQAYFLEHCDHKF